MSPNDADGMANSVDPDQTAPLEAVWSGSALFAQVHICPKTYDHYSIWVPNLFIFTQKFIPWDNIRNLFRSFLKKKQKFFFASIWNSWASK